MRKLISRVFNIFLHKSSQSSHIHSKLVNSESFFNFSWSFKICICNKIHSINNIDSINCIMYDNIPFVFSLFLLFSRSFRLNISVSKWISIEKLQHFCNTSRSFCSLLISFQANVEQHLFHKLCTTSTRIMHCTFSHLLVNGCTSCMIVSIIDLFYGRTWN